MPHAFGYRARTRALHSKAFRKHGTIPLSRRMVNYKIGDYVDIVTDGAVHKGMPHKFYHGRTGKVFDVTQHALGVIVNKVVRNRIVPKRLHIRVEHLRQSRSRESFLDRIRENDKKKRLRQEKQDTQLAPRDYQASQETLMQSQ